MRKKAKTFFVPNVFLWRSALKHPSFLSVCVQERAKCVLAIDLVADGTWTHISPLLARKKASNAKTTGDLFCRAARCRFAEPSFVGNGHGLDEIEQVEWVDLAPVFGAKTGNPPG